MEELKIILFVLVFGLGLLVSFVRASNPSGFALCAIMKDEQDYVEEWLMHHIAIGVDKFFIYDHGSVPSLNYTLANFGEKKYLDIVLIEGGEFWTEVRAGRRIWSPQIWAYNQCLERAKASGIKFMGFVDADEFIVPQKAQDHGILTVLNEFEQYGGLVINWRVFGSSQHQKKPTGGVLENYDRCIPRTEQESRFIKTIANVEHTQKVSPFYCTASQLLPSVSVSTILLLAGNMMTLFPPLL